MPRRLVSFVQLLWAATASLTVCLGSAPHSKALGPAPVADEFQVNTITDNIQQSASVALAEDGDFVVAWQSEIADAGDEIRARRFAANGEAEGDEIAVNTLSARNQNAPSLALDRAGNFVIAWQSLVADNFEIRARRFNADGVARGDEFIVNTRRGESQGAPAVAMSPDGRFVVAWEGPVNGSYEIRARRFDAEGVAQGGEVAVNASSAGSQRFPSIAMNTASDFVIAFRSNVAGSYEIRARRFAANGEPRGDEIAVNALTLGDQLAPTVALDAQGNFVVAWENSLDDSFEIRARRFNARGEAEASEVAVQPATAGNQFAPAVAMAAHGAYVIAWHSQAAESFEIRAQRFTSKGRALASEIAVNNVSAGTQKAAAVAANGHGAFVVAWHSDATSGWEIAARLFQATPQRGRRTAARRE